MLLSVGIPAITCESRQSEGQEFEITHQQTYDFIVATLLATETVLTKQQYFEMVGNLLVKTNISQLFTTLYLKGNKSIGKYFLLYYFIAFPKTKYVTIINSSELKDEDLFFLRYAQELVSLNVSNCPQLTELFAANLIMMKNLAAVNFAGCTGMHPISRQQFASDELKEFLEQLQPQRQLGMHFEGKKQMLLKNIVAYTALQFSLCECLENSQLNLEKHLRALECSMYAMLNSPLRFTESICDLSALIPLTIEFNVINIDARDLADALLANVVSYFPNLQNLNLNDCPVTIAGLWHLRKLPNLHRLSLINTHVFPKFQKNYDNKIAICELLDALSRYKNIRADSCLLRKY